MKFTCISYLIFILLLIALCIFFYVDRKNIISTNQEKTEQIELLKFQLDSLNQRIDIVSQEAEMNKKEALIQKELSEEMKLKQSR